MRILIYENRKCDPVYWDASTPEKEDQAFRCLFKLLDEEWECYSELAATTGSFDRHTNLYRKAKLGDVKALKQLLRLRHDYEYETWHWGDVLDPFETEAADG